jgi:response regulator RpfG family c-di-GMP phosphodiesterase
VSENIEYKFERVMVIDDTAEDTYITSYVITKTNYSREILKFDLATEALEYLQLNINNPSLLPEAVFVDIYMPLMTGFEFLDEFEKLPEEYKSKCTVFVISSSFDERDINRARSNKNVKAYIEKPLRRDFLEGMK